MFGHGPGHGKCVHSCPYHDVIDLGLFQSQGQFRTPSPDAEINPDGFRLPVMEKNIQKGQGFRGYGQHISEKDRKTSARGRKKGHK